MKRLEKSSTNVVISGVLGGIGEYFDIDPVVVSGGGASVAELSRPAGTDQ